MTNTITIHTGEQITNAELANRTADVIEQRGFFQGWFVPPKYAPDDVFEEAICGAAEHGDDVDEQHGEVIGFTIDGDRYENDGGWQGPIVAPEDEDARAEARKACPVCAMGAMNVVVLDDPADSSWMPFGRATGNGGFSYDSFCNALFDTFSDVVGYVDARDAGNGNHASSGVFARYNDSHPQGMVVTALRETARRLA